MKKIKILIVDDFKMIRDGIIYMLESQEKKYKFIIDQAETGEEAIEKSKKYKYDIIIMDYKLPKLNGAETTKEILLYLPKMKILALSNYDEYVNITDMLNAGAKGFVLKNIGSIELVTAIETILNGKNYYSNDVAIKLIHFGNKNISYDKKKIDPLTEREIQIIKLIAEEYTNKEIADKLLLSKRTIDKYRQLMMEKLQVNNAVGLLKRAMELKLISSL